MGRVQLFAQRVVRPPWQPWLAMARRHGALVIESGPCWEGSGRALLEAFLHFNTWIRWMDAWRDAWMQGVARVITWFIRRTPYKRPYKVNAQSHTSAHFYAGDIGHHICTTHTMRLACGQASQWLSCSRNDSQKARGAQRLPARRWLHPARRWCTTRAHTGAPHAPTRASPSTVVSLRWCVRVLTAVKVWVQIDGAELLRRARALGEVPGYDHSDAENSWCCL
jgi:hypothetical protein